MGWYRSCNNGQFTILLDKPSPSTALNPGQYPIKCVLELIQRAIFCVNGFFESTGRLGKVLLGDKVLPEQLPLSGDKSQVGSGEQND